MSANPMQHWRTKYIELDIHFVREKVAIGARRVVHLALSLLIFLPKVCQRHYFWSFGPVFISMTAYPFVQTAGAC
jgi:hypothetical protein